ncbi:hypothetical protein FOA52_011655 [Chlamydomonas sp. UWO 241]|nr:hypothetical protein FOA52_011655 [Chlamydomonas sp. UWO 241]
MKATVGSGWGVLGSCSWVAEKSTLVTIDPAAVDRVAASLSDSTLREICSPAAFDADLHFIDSGPLTAQVVLVVDALNFCFWPDDELEYEHLARGVKAAVQSDPECVSAARLAAATVEDVRRLFGEWPRELPLEAERVRLLREVGTGLLRHYGGSAARLVEAAGGSAMALVELVTHTFPGFRDATVYRGRQVFLYKRAQIFVGDLYGAYGGVGLGAFRDMNEITMFADYRVPVVLRQLGILVYSEALATQVAALKQIPSGSEQEAALVSVVLVALPLLVEVAVASVVEDLEMVEREVTAAPNGGGRCRVLFS